MKSFAHLVLAGLLITPNAFSQNRSMSKLTDAKRLNNQVAALKTQKNEVVKKFITDFEMNVPSNYKSETKWSDLFEKIQQQNKDAKKAKGGFDLGGGASVMDPKTKKRRLLDLAEQDNWEYISFIPVSQELFYHLSSNMFEDIRWDNGISSTYPRVKNKYFKSLDFYETQQDTLVRTKGDALMGIAGLAITNDSNRTTLSGNGESKFYTLLTDLEDIKRKDVIEKINARLQKNGRILRWMFVDFPLENLNDEGFISLLDPTTKRQVAIQKDGVVIIQRQEYDELDNESQAALFLHESVLFAVLTLNSDIVQNNGTAPIRKIVRRMITYQNLFYQPEDKNIDVSTYKNYHQAIDDAIQELIDLGL